MRSPSPVSGDVAQREPDQFARRIVGREMAAGFDDLAQLRVHAFDRVRGVDYAAHRWRKREERNDIGPGAAPRARHGRELLTPRTDLECRELGLCGLGAD